jgi:hypothetical protein
MGRLAAILSCALLAGAALAALLAGAAPAALLAGAAPAAPPVARFGPDAAPLLAGDPFLRAAPAADFWRLIPFYVGQETSAAASVASLVMALNALMGPPADAAQPLLTQGGLLEAVGDAGWVARTVAEAEGVGFEELVRLAGLAAAAVGPAGARIEAFRPTGDDAAALSALRARLAANEAAADDVVLAWFNQGVLTGDWDGPHVSPVGAYDAALDRVLVLDVDRLWYVPYWTPVPRLLEALRRPTGAEHGPLAGETGGLVRITRGR